MAGVDRGSHRERRRARRLRESRHRYGLLVAVGNLASRYGWVMRTLIFYATSLLGLLYLYTLLSDTLLFDLYLKINAQATVFLMNAFGSNVQVAGTRIFTDAAEFRIIDQCTSLGSFAIFAAAVLAVPASGFNKVLGIVLGFWILAAINLVRIISLVYIGIAFPEALEIAHLLVWQTLIVLSGVVLWLMWMRRYGYHPSA